MPYVNRQIDDGVILRWHQREGEEIAFGDKILNFEADRVRLMKRQRSAAFLFRMRGEGSQAEPGDLRFRERTNIRVALQVVASDAGYLRRIDVAEGERARVGDVLALVTTALSEPLGGAASDVGEFRVVANIMESGSEG